MHWNAGEKTIRKSDTLAAETPMRGTYLLEITLSSSVNVEPFAAVNFSDDTSWLFDLLYLARYFLQIKSMDTSQLTEFLVYIVVKPGHERAFLQGALANRAGSIREPGNLRFEMFRNSENSCEFLFAEKYDSLESVTLHRQTPHFQAFFKVLEEVQQFPRRREPGNVVPPAYKPISNE